MALNVSGGSEVTVGTGMSIGRTCPSRVRDGAPVGVWGRSPQKPVCSCQNACLRRFVAESILRLPLPLNTLQSSDLRESHDAARLGQGGQVRIRAHP